MTEIFNFLPPVEKVLGCKETGEVGFSLDAKKIKQCSRQLFMDNPKDCFWHWTLSYVGFERLSLNKLGGGGARVAKNVFAMESPKLRIWNIESNIVQL